MSSMDGGVANIQPILDVALGYEESIVVDKTHALGVCGRTSFINLIVPNDESRTPLSLEKNQTQFLTTFPKTVETPMFA